MSTKNTYRFGNPVSDLEDEINEPTKPTLDIKKTLMGLVDKMGEFETVCENTDEGLQIYVHGDSVKIICTISQKKHDEQTTNLEVKVVGSFTETVPLRRS